MLGSATDTYAISPTANQVSTITTSPGSNVRSFSYLPTGQASGDTRNPSSAYVYAYNKTGRLASASLNSSTVGTYLMNGMEQRVSKVVGSTTTQFVFDRYGHLLAEADGATAATLKEYIWLDDLPVAEIDNTGSSPVIYYVHADHLGRPQKMTDATATIVWDGVFDPFGNVTSVTGSATNLLMFPGQYYDSETQLSQNWNRDYDPSIGRYIQSDPIGLLGGINSYSYVLGNPLLLIDRDGREIACGSYYCGSNIPYPQCGAGSAPMNVVHGIPIGSVLYTLPNGQSFYAPAKADFCKEYAAGKVAGGNPFAWISDIGHFGTYDYQRSGNNFYPAYTNASNFGVGVYMNGAGSSPNLFGGVYSFFNSSNANSRAQSDWWAQGWNAANRGIPSCWCHLGGG